MKNDVSKEPIGPWYRNFNYWSQLALDYMQGYKNIPDSAEHHVAFKAFSELMAYRLVFESNLIEGEGLSAGETRKVIQECFPHIPSSYAVVRRFAEMEKDPMESIIDKNKINDMIEAISKLHPQKGKIIPSIVFADKSRGFAEVYQHHIAYQKSAICALKYEKEFNENIFHKLSESPRGLSSSEYNEIVIAAKINTELFSEEMIKNLHKTIAEGLLPADAKVEAGEYRIDERMVGDFGISFPPPELLAKCMETFIINSNSLMTKFWKNEENIFKVAAKISYEFVRIHPFPDFNGRISRLLLMIIMMVAGVPFAVTLRGDKKGRNRYLSSLKKANKHHMIPYAALIAMRVAELFREIDENINLAGLPSMLSFIPK